jgi:adenine-specific DNA-methyltransferase
MLRRHRVLLSAEHRARRRTTRALLRNDIKGRVRRMAKSTPKHRKLALWSALPPYLGGKRRLCPLIFREVDRLVPRRLWANLTFVDGFLGGGSVSLYAKAQGFRVVATDIAERAIVVGDALVGNSRVRLRREDVLALLAPSDARPGRIETQYAPSVFTKEQARLLDRALELAGETTDRAKSALLRLLAIRVGLLAHPMAQVRAGTIHRLETGEYESITESCLTHYVDGMRLTRPDRLWELAQHINAGVFPGEARVLRRSVLDALPEIEADIAYFDPPYPGVMSYEREYKVIDQILEGAARPTSPFTARDGANMIDELFGRALHIPVWLLSLGNAVVSLEDLKAKMTRLGRTTSALEIQYQHLPAVATEEKKETNREFLVVGYDAAAVEHLVVGERRLAPAAAPAELSGGPHV